MSITVVTPAESYDLTTLPRVKKELNIPTNDGSQDTLLELAIRSSSSFISEQAGRELAQETVDETVPGYGRRVLLVSRTPIISITSILDNGDTVDATAYAIENANAGFISKVSGVWKNTRDIGFGLIPGPDNTSHKPIYTIRYVGGYVLPSFDTEVITLPAWIENLCINLIKDFRNEVKRDSSLVEEEIGDFWRARYGSSSGSKGTTATVQNALERLAGFRRGHLA